MMKHIKEERSKNESPSPNKSPIKRELNSENGNSLISNL